MSFLNKNSINHLYYNINVVNKQDEPIELNYTDIRSQNLLDNVDNYNVSILRFQVDLSEIPIMLFPTTQFETFQQPPYNTIDNGFYKITIQNGNTGEFTTANVEYIANGNQSPGVYNYVDFCQMLNKGIKDAYVGTGIATTDKPYFFYDKSASSINLAMPSTFTEDGITNLIYVNKNLYNDLCRDYPGTKTTFGDPRYFRMESARNGNNKFSGEIVKYASSGQHTAEWTNGILLKTYFPNLGKLSAVRSIVFTTSQIPIVSEYVSDNLDLNNDTSYSFTKVMKDFEISLDGADGVLTRGIQNFVIGSEFQLTQMKSGGEGLKNIDLQAFWRDAHGRLFPLLIPTGSTFTMKMLFVRK